MILTIKFHGWHTLLAFKSILFDDGRDGGHGLVVITGVLKIDALDYDIRAIIFNAAVSLCQMFIMGLPHQESIH